MLLNIQTDYSPLPLLFFFVHLFTSEEQRVLLPQRCTAGSDALPRRQQQQDPGLQSAFLTLKAFAGAFCSMKYLLPPSQHGDRDTWSMRTYGLKAYPV